MINNKNKLKTYENQIEKVIENPVKIISIIEKIIYMPSNKVPLSEDKKIAFWEFVKYYGNDQLERAKQNRWNVEQYKKEIVEMENSIRAIGGFNAYDLPEGLIIKYR